MNFEQSIKFARDWCACETSHQNDLRERLADLRESIRKTEAELSASYVRESEQRALIGLLETQK